MKVIGLPKFSICLLLLLSFGLQASPKNSTDCDLNFKEYPYEPVGECINPEDNVVIQWDAVPTTRCCQNTLNSLSQALALNAIQTEEILLTEEQWKNCTSIFHIQGTISISSCGFDILYKEKGKCSSLTLSSLKLDYGDQYDSLVKSCSQFDVSSFDEQCASCTTGISKMKDYIITDLGVKGKDVEEEICSISIVIAVASSGITNATWVGDFYRCLPAMEKEDHGYFKVKRTIAVGLLVAFVVILLLVLLFILTKYVTKKNSDKPVQGKVVVSTWSGLYIFSKAEIEKAINYGNNKVCLGSGSAGRVYQGVLPSGQVAIKHIYKTAMSGSFTREVEGLSRIRHPNLVTLFGYCIEEEEKYLVYEFCSNGNLAQNLLTNTNILLTENMEPKLSDFGLAKMLGMEETKVFTDVRGTIGYMDPEYMTNAKLTCASDIYSLSIVALQLLSGKKVIDLDVATRDTLTTKAKDVATGKRPLHDFIDRRLNGNLNLRDFESILRVAVLCISRSRSGRPTIKDVFDEVDKAWRNALANMPTIAKSEIKTSSALQSQSLEVVIA